MDREVDTKTTFTQEVGIVRSSGCIRDQSREATSDNRPRHFVVPVVPHLEAGVISVEVILSG